MQYRTGAGLILAAGVVWSTQGLGIRMIEQAESWAVLAWRSLGLIFALTLYIAFAARGHVWGAITSVGRGGVAGALALALAFGGAIYAMQTTAIANAVVLFAAAPFFAALIGWAVLGERVTPSTALAIAAAGIGIIVMVGGAFASGALLGNLAALISALGFGAFSVALRHLPRPMRADTGPFPIVLLAGIFSAIVGVILALKTGQDLTPPVGDVTIAISMGMVTLAGGMVLYALGTRAVSAAAATLLAQLEVILAPFWVWLVLGEKISQSTALGGGIVLAALVFNVAASRSASRTSAAGGPNPTPQL